MAVNKVVINQDGVENVLVDITDSTVTPETLAEGETAYGANGEKIVGSMKPGIDTSDATATADYIAKGRTAYVKGEKITGTVRYTTFAGELPLDSFVTNSSDSPPSLGWNARTEESMMLPAGALVRIKALTSAFGDATPEDVAKGKTFTSVGGMCLYGTGSTTIDITDDGNGNLTIANAKVTYNNGALNIAT